MAIDVGSAVAYLELDTSRFETGVASAMGSLNMLTNSSSSLSQKISGLGSAISSVGLTLTKSVTLPVAGLGAASVKVASDFESAMSKVEAISGSNAEEMESLTEKAIEMGAKTKFSAKESAEAFTYMAMAGWKAEQMIDGISGIMSLAAADGLDLATTSDIVTDALTAFGLKAEDSAHFADVLAQASSSANTNVSMLGESFKYIAPVAGALGMNVEDTALALGLMANSGIKSSQAGTSLRAALTNMVKPTDKMAIKMEELGISMTDSEGKMLSLREIMVMLRESFSELSEAEQANAAATLFGKEAMSGMLAIINTSDEDFNKLAGAIDNADGRADAMAETMMNNLGGSIEQLLGAIESFAIRLGGALSPVIRKIADNITVLVEKMNEMTDEEIQQVVKIAAIVAAIGPLLTMFGKLVMSLSAIGHGLAVAGSGLITFLTHLGEATALYKAGFSAMAAQTSVVFKALVTLTGPVGMMVVAIGTLVAAFATLWKTSEEFRTSITGTFNKMKESFNNFSQSFVDKINELGFDFENLTDMLSSAWMAFCEFLRPIFEESFAYIGDLFSGVLDVILGITDVFVGAFTGDWEQVKEGLAGIFESIEEMGRSKFTHLFEAIKGVFQNTFGVDLIAVFNSAKESVLQFFQNIGEAFSIFINETIPNFIESVRVWFEQLPYNVGYAIGYAIEYIRQFGVDIIEWAAEAIPQFVSNVGEFLAELPEKVWNWLTQTLEKIRLWKDEMVKKAIETGSEFLKSVIEEVKQLPDKLYQKVIEAKNKVSDAKSKMMEAGKNIMTGFWDGLKEVWGNISDWFDGLSEKISNFFQGIKDGVADAKNALQGVGDAANGSHANGLSYVPFDGYVAQLHKGERVLTKAENKEYNEGNTGSGGDTYIFNSPNPIDEYEAARLFRRTKLELEFA